MYWSPFYSTCLRLKELIIDELFSQYEYDERIIRTSRKYYDYILLLLKDLNQTDIHLFTTNYDSVLENYCLNCDDIEYTCGFRIDHRSNRQYWHGDELKTPKWTKNDSKKVRIYKLHGSLDWRKASNGRIEKLPIEERVSPRTKKYTENLLIYPAEKDYSKGEPFRKLQRYFETILDSHNICLVIGYSFRDPQINNVFMDYLRDGKNSIVALSPTASRDVKINLIREEKELMRHVVCLDEYFGSSKAESVLKRVFSMLYTGEIDIEGMISDALNRRL